MSDVRIVFRKYGGALHWNYPATLLGEDDHGIWVAAPAGTVARKGEGPPVIWDLDAITLFPRDAWWAASFNVPPHPVELYVDVTTIPEWHDGEITMVDLDLDVIRTRDGRLILDDEDEFAEHQVSLGYPSDVIAQAESSARWLLDAVKERREPFGNVQAQWMARLS